MPVISYFYSHLKTTSCTPTPSSEGKGWRGKLEERKKKKKKKKGARAQGTRFLFLQPDLCQASVLRFRLDPRKGTDDLGGAKRNEKRGWELGPQPCSVNFLFLCGTRSFPICVQLSPITMSFPPIPRRGNSSSHTRLLLFSPGTRWNSRNSPVGKTGASN